MNKQKIYIWTRTIGVLAAFFLCACAAAAPPETSAEPSAEPAAEVTAEAENTEQAAEPTGDIVVLYTSDIHCGIDEGFGFVGLQQIRDTLEKKGTATLLVDDGDAVQGDVVGTLTDGEA